MKILQNTLYISTPEAYLRLEGETVCVMIDRKKRIQVPLHHFNSFVLFESVMLSPALLGYCAKKGLTVVWLDWSGHFQCRLEGEVSGNILLRQAQFRQADDSNFCIEIARCFVAGKIRNSRQLLIRAARENKQLSEQQHLNQVVKLLAGTLKKLALADNLDSIRGFEGDAARSYFSVLSLVMKESLRADFPFTQRTRRPPKDAFNALISFLYALLMNDCRTALETVGLDSQLGFFHVPRSGRASLALDMQEEFRAPLCDRLALTLLNRGQLKLKDFDFRAGGSVLLNDKGRKTVIAAYQDKKKEEITHPILEKSVEIGLLVHVQARFLARYLRGDIEAYVPFLQR